MMTDIVSPEKRSRMMSGIRGKDTGLEILLRSGLHRAGYRFRLHAKALPGRPDIVLAKHEAVIQANGCFWHGHDCPLFKVPATNREKWVAKIDRNRERDATNRRLLLKGSWRVLEVWECAVRGPGKMTDEELIKRVCEWIDGDLKFSVFRSAEAAV